MRRQIIAVTNAALYCSTKISWRCYYDKVRKDRDGSDASPSEMFEGFPRSATPNRVPEAFHKTDNDAVDAAEKIQKWFLTGFIIFALVIALSNFMDPFSEGYKRPEGYGFHPIGKEMENASGLGFKKYTGMTKETAKRNVRRNATRMQIFTTITWGVNIVSSVFFLFHRGTIPYFRDFAAIFFWATQEIVSLHLLKKFATPTLSAAGELLDCPDASNPQELGVYSLAQDVLWSSWVVQLLCVFFHWGFVALFLPVPAMILYKAWSTFVGPLLRSRYAAKEDEPSAGGPSPQSRSERRRQEIRRRKGKA